MKNKIDYSDFTERYLNEKMGQDELNWFNQEMEINQFLAEEVQLQKDIGNAILNDETLAFRAQINSLFDKNKSVNPAKAKRAFRIPVAIRLAVASIASLIILGTGLYLYSHRTISADKLFYAYYEPYDGLITARSENSEMADMLAAAMQKYEQREFESALVLFEAVLASDSENITSKFYSGVSYLETKRFRGAEESFTGIIKHEDNLFIEHAKWYLGLCYLQMGEDSKAKELFSSIARSESYYSKTANRIIRNL